jgi:hypothetical protein
MKSILVQHLKMNYELGKTIFDNINNEDKDSKTSYQQTLIYVFAYCQAFGGIWKIYNKEMTYSKTDREEIELVFMYKWCETFSGKYFGCAL